MATKHHDSKRTDVSHDKAVTRRVEKKRRALEQHLADRAMRRLFAEINAKAGE